MTKNIITTALVSLCIGTSTFAQSTKSSNVHIGFAYPISTNGTHAAEYTNNASFHAISGISYSEKAFCASGVTSIVKDSVTGFIGSGVANIIGNKANGMQAAGFANYTKNLSKGLQAAGFINLSGEVIGAQTAGFANITMGNVNGLQAAGFVNTAANSIVQLAGFINLADSNTAQVAGFINIARSIEGTQVAGFTNVANVVEGSQVAGFINVAHKVKGAQISGFINIADSSDYPIGLINIIKNGEKAVGVMVDETGTTFLTFRSGGRILYGIVGMGYNGSRGRDIFATQAGLGAHLPISRSFRINGEATATSLADFRRTADLEAAIKVMPAYKVWKLEIFAGPSFNYAMSPGLFGAPFDHHSFWTEKSYDRTHDFYIGAQACVQLHF